MRGFTSRSGREPFHQHLEFDESDSLVLEDARCLTEPDGLFQVHDVCVRYAEACKADI